MEDNNTKKIPPIILFAALAQAIVMLILIVIIVNSLNRNDKIENRNSQPTITLEDFSINETTLPTNYLEDLTHSITDAVILNTTDLNVPNSNAIVRSNSIGLVNFERKKFKALNFIIDIPTLQQSYQVYYKYPSDLNLDDPFINNPRAVLCLEDASLMIYPEFNCQSSYPSDTRHRIATDYLKFLEFNQFTTSINPQHPNQIIINPITDVSDAVGSLYIDQIKNALTSLGISPDSFEYRIQKKQDLDYTITQE